MYEFFLKCAFVAMTATVAFALTLLVTGFADAQDSSATHASQPQPQITLAAD